MDSKLQIYIWKWNPKLADAVISVDLELFLDKGFLSLLPIRAEKETMELVVDDVAVDEQTVQVEEVCWEGYFNCSYFHGSPKIAGDFSPTSDFPYDDVVMHVSQLQCLFVE